MSLVLLVACVSAATAVGIVDGAHHLGQQPTALNRDDADLALRTEREQRRQVRRAASSLQVSVAADGSVLPDSSGGGAVAKAKSVSLEEAKTELLGDDAGSSSRDRRGDWDFIATKIALRTGVTPQVARQIFYPRGNLELGDLKHLFGMPKSAGTPFLWGGINRPGFRISMCANLKEGVEGHGYLLSDTPAGNTFLHPANPMPGLHALKTASRMQAELVSGLQSPTIGVLINKIREVDLNHLLFTQTQAPALLEKLKESPTWTPSLTIYNQIPLDDTEMPPTEFGNCEMLLTHSAVSALQTAVGAGFSCIDCGDQTVKDCLQQAKLAAEQAKAQQQEEEQAQATNATEQGEVPAQEQPQGEVQVQDGEAEATPADGGGAEAAEAAAEQANGGEEGQAAED